MTLNKHPNLKGLHAPFSPSSSAWVRYSDDQVVDFFINLKAAELGTKIHKWAEDTINLGFMQEKSKKTVNAYVNDAIGYSMDTEVTLYYSENFFGTADAISFNDNLLRIHDLKTGKKGKIESHVEQLQIYAALFCLENLKEPKDISIELRIYKNDDVLIVNPDPKEIKFLMNRIIYIDNLISKIKI